MKAHIRGEKMVNKPSAFDDFLVLCTHLGLTDSNQKRQALANLRVKDWLLPKESISSTKLYKYLEKSKSTPAQCGSDPDEWRALTVFNAFMPAVIHIIANIPAQEYEYCRYGFGVFLYRLLPAEAGQALIADKFFNPVNQSQQTWIKTRLFFLWSNYFSGTRSNLLVDALRVLMAVYVASYVSEELAVKLFSFAVHVMKTTPLGEMACSRATLHAVADIIPPEGDGLFEVQSLRNCTLAQLNIKGICFPRCTKMESVMDWSYRETYNYGWDLSDSIEGESLPWKDVLSQEMYAKCNQKKARETIEMCRCNFSEDYAFLNGTLAAYERVVYASNMGTSEKERRITAEYEKKFEVMSSRLSEKAAEHQEAVHTLSRAEKRIKELEGIVAEKDARLVKISSREDKLKLKELERLNAMLNNRLSSAQRRISSLEAHEDSEKELQARVAQLEHEVEFYKEMQSVEEFDLPDESVALSDDELEQLKGIRVHMVLPNLTSLRRLKTLMPASRFTYKQVDHTLNLDIPQSMELYAFCTRIASHSDWDNWKMRTKNYTDRRVYCPYTGVNTICRFLLHEYTRLQHKTAGTL